MVFSTRSLTEDMLAGEELEEVERDLSWNRILVPRGSDVTCHVGVDRSLVRVARQDDHIRFEQEQLGCKRAPFMSSGGTYSHEREFT